MKIRRAHSSMAEPIFPVAGSLQRDWATIANDWNPFGGLLCGDFAETTILDVKLHLWARNGGYREGCE